jgi:hypothetical protein
MARLLITFFMIAVASVAHAGARAALSPAQASQFAAEIANAHCQWRFGYRPFDPSAAEPILADGRWHWKAIAAAGYSDLTVEVTFSQTGESPTVRLDLMGSRVAPPGRKW